MLFGQRLLLGSGEYFVGCLGFAPVRFRFILYKGLGEGLEKEDVPAAAGCVGAVALAFMAQVNPWLPPTRGSEGFDKYSISGFQKKS